MAEPSTRLAMPVITTEFGGRQRRVGAWRKFGRPDGLPFWAIHPAVEILGREQDIAVKVVGAHLADHVLNDGTNKWKQIGECSAFIVDAAIGYQTPGVALGRDVAREKAGEPTIVLPTCRHAGKTDVAVVAMELSSANLLLKIHDISDSLNVGELLRMERARLVRLLDNANVVVPDGYTDHQRMMALLLNARVTQVTFVGVEDRLLVVEHFPPREGKYPLDAVTTIPRVNGGTDGHSRLIDRAEEGPEVAMVTRYTMGGDNLQTIDVRHHNTFRFGVAIEIVDGVIEQESPQQ